MSLNVVATIGKAQGKKLRLSAIEFFSQKAATLFKYTHSHTQSHTVFYAH